MATTGRRGLCDITNATPYVYNTDKPALLQLTTQRSANRRVLNDDNALLGDITAAKPRVEEKTNTRYNDIEYMPPRSMGNYCTNIYIIISLLIQYTELPYEPDVPLNWHKIVGPDNPHCYSFRRTVSLSTWSSTRTPETVNMYIKPMNGKSLCFYISNKVICNTVYNTRTIL
jgi:hypothetical protein